MVIFAFFAVFVIFGSAGNLHLYFSICSKIGYLTAGYLVFESDGDGGNFILHNNLITYGSL